MSAIFSILPAMRRRFGGALASVSAPAGVALGPLLPVAGVGLVLAALATVFARHWWLADLATHFRLHYALGGLAAALLALLVARRRMALLLLALTLPQLAGLHGLARLEPAIAAAAPPPAVLRVTTINAFWDNRSSDRIVAHVRAAAPDILVVQEAWHSMAPALGELARLYPFRAPADIARTDDLALFSRFPIRRVEQVHTGATGFVYLQAELEVAGRPVTVFGVHPPWRRSASISAARDRYLADLAARVAGLDMPVIVAGDFNSTLWSPTFRDFLAETGLTSAGEIHGWRPTWPARLPALGIAIDHVTVTDRLTVLGVSRGPDVGSDHLPLTADLALH